VETCAVQTDLSCVLLQRKNIKRFLILEKDGDVFKKFSLSVGSICGLGCFARPLVLIEREISNYKANFVAVRLQDIFQNGMHSGAGRTLKVSEFNNCYRSIRIAARGIVVNADVLNGLWGLIYYPANVSALAEFFRKV